MSMGENLFSANGRNAIFYVFDLQAMSSRLYGFGKTELQILPVRADSLALVRSTRGTSGWLWVALLL